MSDEKRIDDLDKRVYNLESEFAVMNVRLEALVKSQEKTNSILGKMNWVLIAGFLGGIIAFVIEGGLHGGH